jgi:hypothetical protein
MLAMCAARAMATVTIYDAALSGPAESPPNASPGTGFAEVTHDSVAHTMRVQVSFSGLTGNTTASHIHAPTPVPFDQTAGVATQTPTFTGFPLGVTAGSYDHTFDMTDLASYNNSFMSGSTAAQKEAGLFGAIDAGKGYLNIHSQTFGGGEIRGFLIAVPEPGALSLVALAGLAALRRKRA